MTARPLQPTRAMRRVAKLARWSRLKTRRAALFAGAMTLAATRTTTVHAQARPPVCVAAPGAPQPLIDVGIAGIASAQFLSQSERRDIFCDNAARFYRLDAKARPTPPSLPR